MALESLPDVRGGNAGPSPWASTHPSDLIAGDDPIVAAVTSAIMDGRLPGGTKLGEEKLAQIFDVGRGAVRAALRHLAFVGLVSLFPNRGAYVARYSREDAEHVYAARRLVEMAVIREVAEHCTAADIRRLKEHLERERVATEAGNRQEALRLSGAFHVLVASLSGNPVISEIVAQLVPRTALLLTLYQSSGDTYCGIHDHEALIDLLAKGDGEGCGALLARHLRATEGRLHIDSGRTGRVDLDTVFGSVPIRHAVAG